MSAVFFYGEDMYAAREALTELAAQRQAELVWYDAEDLAARSVEAMLDQGASLFGRRMNVVRDPSRLPKSVQEQLAGVVQRGQDTSVLWERGIPDRRSQLWRVLRQHAQEFAPLSLAELQSWLIDMAGQRGGTLDRVAAGLLVERVGLDRWRLLHELERLLLSGVPVTAELVAAEIAVLPETEVFALLEAIGRGEGRAAGRHLVDLLAGGAGELYILTMLAYQFRTLLVVQVGLAEGRSEQELARAARLHPYVVQKNMGLARRLSQVAVRGALTRILATDTAIKNGTVDARTAVVMLVLGLVRQVKMASSS